MHECTFCTNVCTKKSIEESTQCQRNMLSRSLYCFHVTPLSADFFLLFFSFGEMLNECLHATTNLNTFDKFFDLFCALFLFRFKSIQFEYVYVARVCAVLLLFIYLLFVRPNCVCDRKNHRLTIQFPLFVLSTRKISCLDKCFAIHAAKAHKHKRILHSVHSHIVDLLEPRWWIGGKRRLSSVFNITLLNFAHGKWHVRRLWHEEKPSQVAYSCHFFPFPSKTKLPIIIYLSLISSAIRKCVLFHYVCVVV